jgi:hypothetical protein
VEFEEIGAFLASRAGVQVAADLPVLDLLGLGLDFIFYG